MHLKSLELNGFKSFGKKSRLSFTSPVVCVVGPNGSGKSNVVEAFRFVLGEQSMKSLRGKSGKDLIFKGSSGAGKLARASVSIVFDNKDKAFKLPSTDTAINLDFDEIVITREVFADGNNSYYINNSSVRLKDIIELLSSVGIGSSGHHIISQGNADRILVASPKERRAMVEDALGLKIYQFRLKESEKKLAKTRENIKETEIIRRELAPHLRYLKKQVEKIQKGEEIRNELTSLYFSYFQQENSFLFNEESFLKNEKGTLEQNLKQVSERLLLVENKQDDSFEVNKNREIEDLAAKISKIREEKDVLARALGKLDGLIEIEEEKTKSGEKIISLKGGELNSFIDEVHDGLDSVLRAEDISKIPAVVVSIKDKLSAFRQKFKITKEVDTKDLEALLAERQKASEQISFFDEKIKSVNEEIITIRAQITKEKEERYRLSEERFSLESDKQRILSRLEILENRKNIFERRKTAFEEEMREAVVLVGQSILSFEKSASESVLTESEIEDLRKRIERLKIKLEDIGAGGGGDVLKEYEEVSSRDVFLVKELADLEASMKNLESLISELKETLDREFKEGVQKINERFEEFFKLMFGGGGAFLSILVEKPKKKDENMDDLEIFDEEKSFENGLDINVSLPQKKVKELTMLSGGERSLTSIALLFAMSQVNPPPFLVLDETDAALDEANSKRYGDMLERLSKNSPLIVVTHNRETMSRADLIYGVTIGGDGVSKLLSIKFAEAEGYAK